jgi:hypothetical protein
MAISLTLTEGRCGACRWWGGGPYWDHCRRITHNDDSALACIDESGLEHCEAGNAHLLVSEDFGCVLWESNHNEPDCEDDE